MKATISLRVSTFIWMSPKLCGELLAWMRDYRETIEEVAFFTGFTHPPLPLAEVQRRAGLLAGIIPQFKAVGLRTGINHLATIGHLDENLENSLREPWQHLVDVSGSVSASCYCAADPNHENYIRESYVALAEAKPDFIWIDDDVRMEGHAGAIAFACFCDRCVAKFSAETGTNWTREKLRQAFSSGPMRERLALRRKWLQHNRDFIDCIMRTARDAVDSVNPGMPLGLMTGETSYSGYGNGAWADTLAGKRRIQVKWRPGGGFYTDERPLDMLGKAHSVGRQTALLPQHVQDVQWEHENFPYQVLKKSETAFLAEIAAAIGAGCTGVALNTMGIAADPFNEYRRYFDAVARTRPFFDEAVGAFGRSTCEGVWPAFTIDHMAALAADKNWPGGPAWGGDLWAFNEMAEIGLPMAYSRPGARICLLSGDGVLEWTREELTQMLSGAVMMDGPALVRLSQMGLTELAGFVVAGTKEKDTTEQFTADDLNGRFAGWHRDCRPSFWPQPTYLLKPIAAGARPLSEIIDFTPRSFGCGSGAFENRLGGRVAVFGYYPWSALQCLAKTSQMKAVCLWAARDALPGYVESFHRAALWCRRDAAGRPALLLLNATIDTARDVRLRICGTHPTVRVTDMSGRTGTLKAASTAGPYSGFNMPAMGPWSAVLVRT